MKSVRRPLAVALLLLFCLVSFAAAGKKNRRATGSKDEQADVLSPETFSGLTLRSIGPALTSGRIADLAVDPGDSRRYFVAAASGGVWLTTNGGTTYEPVFDDQGSYSIGCVAIAPHHPLIVWVGTGENNSQRSVGYGDGVYRAPDGGRSFEKMGLENSDHIGKTRIDPPDVSTSTSPRLPSTSIRPPLV